MRDLPRGQGGGGAQQRPESGSARKDRARVKQRPRATRLPRCRGRGASAAGREMLPATPPRSARARATARPLFSLPACRGGKIGRGPAPLAEPRIGSPLVAWPEPAATDWLVCIASQSLEILQYLGSSSREGCCWEERCEQEFVFFISILLQRSC